MALKAIDPTKPILGYSLKNRVGTGGFGEVWAAEAPGGLPKAVKFIFGYHDDNRAQAELKALNRIRMVRHPFLLSLERIDVVDGQMVVITELADMCLKTRFEQCVESGLNGIPRAELLGYIRDAASALDFISTEFSLQHLDIKPENLLLVSGHVKVADFGLVKDIHDGTQSMLSGLTPAYAPPELFDGRPSKTSDQYSLAIMFQEMLTGIRPFNGTTAAQLASQHIKERPNLKPLPREDQATISRALSKDPELRYPSCSEMVQALFHKDRETGGSAPRTRTKLREIQRQRRRKKKADSSTFTVTGTTPFGISPTEVQKLPTESFDSTSSSVRPTLLVGIGGTGGKILTQIRQRLNDRVGDRDSIPSFKFLCLDTDISDLHQVQDAGLTEQETFALPLRRPEQYRTDAKMHLTWLSRRWIYNVPKSLRTEGIRPLGRLAMATHIDALTIRLRQVISELVQPEALSETASTLNLDPQTSPRVILVGSLSGGTCSGMGIDIAYIVRGILRQLDVANEDVLGFFTHSSRNIREDGDLTIANTLAFLSELYHFSCVEEYPGDHTCGIPALTDGTTTFAATYLLHLGDHLNSEKYATHIDKIAEYLFQSFATPCATFLDVCRSKEVETKGMPLRTVGLARSSNEEMRLVDHATRLLQQEVLSGWTSASEMEDAPTVATQIMKDRGLDVDHLICLVHETINRTFEDPSSEIAERLANEIDLAQQHDSHDRVCKFIRSVFGDLENGNSETTEPSEIQLLANFATERAKIENEALPSLVAVVLGFIDQPGQRFSAARLVTSEIEQYLTDQIAQIEVLLDNANAAVQNLLQRLKTEELASSARKSAYFVEFAETLLQRFSLSSVLDVARAILSFGPEVKVAIKDVQEKLESAMQYLDDSETEFTYDPELIADQFLRNQLQMVQELIPRMGDRVEQQLEHNFLDHCGGLRAALEDRDDRTVFADRFVASTRTTIAEQLAEFAVAPIFANDDVDVGEFAAWINRAAMPRLLACGGATRVLQGYPQRSPAPQELVDAINANANQVATVVSTTLGEILTCYEVEQIPLDNVSMHLLQNRPDSIEFASRLHARTDIEWTPITSMR